MSNKEQFNHNIKKAKRQRITKNNIKNLNNLIDYLDFEKICDDFKLKAKTISPGQMNRLEEHIEDFIKKNCVYKKYKT